MFKIPMWRADNRSVTLNAPLAQVALSSEETGEHAETTPLPPAIAATPPEDKTPAQWAYERMILYIQNFEKTLDDAHEVGLGFVSGGAGVMRITGMGYFAPDLISFYGVDEQGAKTQLVQHVSQLNVMLKAAAVQGPSPARRIGFQLRKVLEEEEE